MFYHISVSSIQIVKAQLLEQVSLLNTLCLKPLNRYFGDTDEMPRNSAFHAGSHCLLSFKHSSVNDVHLNLEVVSCLQVSRMKRIKIVNNHCNTFVILILEDCMFISIFQEWKHSDFFFLYAH